MKNLVLKALQFLQRKKVVINEFIQLRHRSEREKRLSVLITIFN